MKTQFDYSKVRVSWTKYDIVYIIDVVESREALDKFRSIGGINDSILKAFLGVDSLSNPIPDFWDEVFKWPEAVRKCFAVFLFAFTNSTHAKQMIASSMISPMHGKFIVDGSKQSTNWRSLLVQSGLASRTDRRNFEVPFDGRQLLNDITYGKVMRKALENLIQRYADNYDANEFYEICNANDFPSILGMDAELFCQWTGGLDVSPKFVRSLEFDKFLCFDTPCALDFCCKPESDSNVSKEIYFLGENGDGKTVLLYSLFAAFKSCHAPVRTEVDEILKEVKGSEVIGVDNLNRKFTMETAPEFPNFFAYGTHRGRYSAEIDKPYYEKDGFMSLFSTDMTLPNPSHWLQNQFLTQSKHVEFSRDNLIKILSELLESRVDIKLNEENQIVYVEKGYELTLSKLSEGYRSILIFVCDLLIRLSKFCPEDQNVFDQFAVVLVDEIDQHLHPKWQLTIVRKLRKLFPNIQFIMTTHSPVMVMGSSEDAIFFRVTRTEGRTSVSDPYYRSTMDKFMMNTLITSSLFDLDSAAMNPHALDADTSSDLISSKIHKAVRKRIEEDKRSGKWNYTEAAIDSIISEVMKDYDTHK